MARNVVSMETTAKLTQSDIENLANHDEWGGFGYIGERRSALEGIATGEQPAYLAEKVAAADAEVLRVANARGWDADRLFEWANSKNGRWFADCMIGSDGRHAHKYL